MTAAASLSAILSSLHGYGTSMLTIIAAVLVIALGYLIYRVGWGHVKNSLSTGYFKGNTRYKDQALGRAIYEVQEKGMTRF